MPRTQQTHFSFHKKPNLTHGGDIRKGKRKEARVIALKQPMRIVMKSHCARGRLNLLRSGNSKIVKKEVAKFSKRFGVRIYRFVNVGNHLHFVVVAKRRRSFQNFLRVCAGQIAMKVTGAKKGERFGQFWEKLAFTRAASWGRQWGVLKKYITKNYLESLGFPRLDKMIVRSTLAANGLARAGPGTV